MRGLWGAYVVVLRTYVGASPHQLVNYVAGAAMRCPMKGGHSKLRR